MWIFKAQVIGQQETAVEINEPQGAWVKDSEKKSCRIPKVGEDMN